MICMCGNKECDFDEHLAASANLIFTPRPGIRQRELLHVLQSGVRSINIDLNTSTKEKLQKLVDNVDWTVKIFLSETKFNLRITKICTIRGRQPRTGRMRNGDTWNLKKCDELVLTCDKRYEKCSSDKVCYVSNLKTAIDQLNAGDFIDIGCAIKVKITKVAMQCFVTCYVVGEGCLKSHQQVNLPVAVNESLNLTDEETEDCEFAIMNQFDVVIVPFVSRPEHYHTIERTMKGSGIKLIPQINTIDCQAIDKIIEHFYGVYIDSYANDYVVDKARQAKKLIIAEFSVEGSTMDAADSFLLKPSKCAKSVVKFIDLHKVSVSLASKSQKQSNDEPSQVTDNTTQKKHFENALEMSRTQNAKAIICLTPITNTVEEIACGRPACPIVVLTKCPSIAKLLQLWRNVLAMVYVDCDNKPWVDQRNEMAQIAAMYGNDLKMLEANDLIVTWFNSKLTK